MFALSSINRLLFYVIFICHGLWRVYDRLKPPVEAFFRNTHDFTTLAGVVTVEASATRTGHAQEYQDSTSSSWEICVGTRFDGLEALW